MRQTSFILLAAIILGVSILPLMSKSCGKEKTGTLNQMHAKVQNMQDAAKQKKIESAAAMYMAEAGFSPANLDDLVQKGYLQPQDILDHQGNKFSYTPEIPDFGSGITVISKSCGRCGKSVPTSSKAGDRCPHCGVIWGMETTNYSF